MAAFSFLPFCNQIMLDAIHFNAEFYTQTSNHGRVKCLWKILNKSGLFSCLTLVKYVPKSNKESLKYRNMGNQYFSLTNRNFWTALEFYNQSICYAENNSINLSLGYSNRSAVCFELKEYDACLENIKLARNSFSGELSTDLQEKLNKRTVNCLLKLSQLKLNINKNSNGTEEFIPQLSYPPHSEVPFIADCLELKKNEEFGRFIVTNRDLKVGDCIAIESSTNITLESSFIYSRCSYCARENYFSLIPCTNCTGAMFCNSDCYTKGFELFHKFECSVINVLNTVGVIDRSAIRVVLGLFSNIDELDNIKLFLTKKDAKQLNIFNSDFVNRNTISFKYKLIHGLEIHENKRSFDNFMMFWSTAVFFYEILKDNFCLKELFAKDRLYEELFLDVLVRQLLTVPLHFNNLHSNVFKQPKNKIIHLQNVSKELGSSIKYGSGYYQFLSILNHSCSPNVILTSKENNDQCLYVLRNIAKGEQLFSSYVPHHTIMVKAQRQMILKERFFFDCKCNGCKLNYPLHDKLPVNANLRFCHPEHICQQLENNDKKFAKKVFNECVNYLRKHDEYYPAAQVVEAQLYFQKCLYFLVE